VAGVNAIGQLLARAVAALASVLERHVGICAERQQLFFTLKSVLQAPPLTPGWGNNQEQAALVKELDRLGARLGRADSGIGKGHGWG